jgi:Zn-finger nucleic acid-binding protein
LTKIAEGIKAKGVFSYINELDELISSVSVAKTTAEFSEIDHLHRAMASRAAAKVKDVMTRFNSSKDKKKTKLNDKFAVDLIAMSRAHMLYLSFVFFRDSIEAKTYQNPKSKEVLYLLAKVFALKQLSLDSVGLYETGFFKPGANALLTESLKECLI